MTPEEKFEVLASEAFNRFKAAEQAFQTEMTTAWEAYKQQKKKEEAKDARRSGDGNNSTPAKA